MRDDLIERITAYISSKEGQIGMMNYRAAPRLLDEARAAIVELEERLDDMHYEIMNEAERADL